MSALLFAVVEFIKVDILLVFVATEVSAVDNLVSMDVKLDSELN